VLQRVFRLARRGRKPIDHRVTLLTRPGCHLCEDARTIVASVCAEQGTPWEERDISTEPELLARWTDDVPVTLVDGRHLDSLRLSAERLRAALTT
jgi:glutaredoxin